MQKRTLGIMLMVIGVVAVIVSLGADALRIGGSPGIGWRQALGAVVGVIIVAVGAWYWPGFPRSRMMADEAASPSPRKSGGSGGRTKARTAKSSTGSARRGTSRGSRRGRKKYGRGL